MSQSYSTQSGNPYRGMDHNNIPHPITPNHLGDMHTESPMKPSTPHTNKHATVDRCPCWLAPRIPTPAICTMAVFRSIEELLEGIQVFFVFLKSDALGFTRIAVWMWMGGGGGWWGWGCMLCCVLVIVMVWCLLDGVSHAATLHDTPTHTVQCVQWGCWVLHHHHHHLHLIPVCCWLLLLLFVGVVNDAVQCMAYTPQHTPPYLVHTYSQIHATHILTNTPRIPSSPPTKPNNIHNEYHHQQQHTQRVPPPPPPPHIPLAHSPTQWLVLP